MGNNLFGANISGRIARALGPKLLRATLIRRLEGTRDSTALDEGTRPTTSSHSARGIVDDYDEKQVDGTLIQQGDRRVLLLGDTIAGRKVPEPNDEVTISGGTYVIVRVATDPDKAAYVCQARRQ